MVGRGWRHGAQDPRGPRGLIAIMARNRLVTAETENVSILDGKSNDRTLTLLHPCHGSVHHRAVIVAEAVARTRCDYDSERKIATNNPPAGEKNEGKRSGIVSILFHPSWNGSFFSCSPDGSTISYQFRPGVAEGVLDREDCCPSRSRIKAGFLKVFAGRKSRSEECGNDGHAATKNTD